MEAHWLTEDGQIGSAQIEAVFPRGFEIAKNNQMPTSIGQITCPTLAMTFRVTRSSVHKHSFGIVVVLEEFENNTDEWMRWVELLTRIDRRINSRK